MSTLPRLRAVAALAATVLGLGAVACSIDPPDGRFPTPPAVSPSETPPVVPDLQRFFGDDLRIRERGAFGLADVTFMPVAPGCARTYMRVHYPAGSASQASVRDEGAPSGGAQAYLLLRDGPTDDLHLGYRVRFQDGFQFARGGKLPGLFGGTQVAGGNTPDGTNGFSTRYMWRAGGKGQVYAYLPESEEYGTTLGPGRWVFPSGRWTTVQQHVRLNTPGAADGSITVWIDGAEVFRQDGLVYRTTPALHIDGVFFSTFFGGEDLSWASPVDQHADFADITVSDRFVPAGPPGSCSGAAPRPASTR